MASFEQILSGVPEMDKILDYVRLGDNVVWRVSHLEDFQLFMDRFVEQAIADGRKIIYLRFASHEPLIKERPEVKRINVPLSHRFETFSVDIHNIIQEEARESFYIFDCMSELQTAWATDMMMGNFFKVTCPTLFNRDCVAYFPIIRGKHSVNAVEKISSSAQVFLDIYSDNRNIYVRPEKVWNRYSETMFMTHIYNTENGSFKPILDGVKASRFHQVYNSNQRPGDEQYTDSWDRFFKLTKLMNESHMDVSDACNRMCDIMMTRDAKMREMIKKHFRPEDYFDVWNHMIGTGMIGGKACGMLLARAIIRNTQPEIYKDLEPHDSFYIGSDFYYTYIVDNGYWDLRVRQRSEKEYFQLAAEFAERLKTGTFASAMRDHFKFILDYYGQDPYIVRSSSILEDGFGNAFAGKYDSVFCTNRGTLEERLDEFEAAVKTVYASSMSLSALDYRKRRGLDKRDEQMALLVQRVSGSYYGPYYMPCAAGVGYSFSPYKFLKAIDPAAGMLRLVMGLGTSAVDRTEGSYPRLVSLDMPEASTCVTTSEKHQFSQRKIEVIDMKERCLKQLTLAQLEPYIPKYLADILLERDFETERRLSELGKPRQIKFVSCHGLVGWDEVMHKMQQMMLSIQTEYDYPVDIEFTMNVSEDGEYVINLLQCRPLQVFKDTGKVTIPEVIPEENIILENVESSMGLSRNVDIDTIVYVDPMSYYNMPYGDKSKVARLIGDINWKYAGQGRHMMLMVPGRIGTSSPELGVPTTFSDISEFEAICEIAENRVGYNPELSFGSHIFQDLVEAEILYTAVFYNWKTKKFLPERLEHFENIVGNFAGGDGLKDVVSVYDVSHAKCKLYHDLKAEHLVLTCEITQ